MVAMGTGMAPFKGFVEERHVAKKHGVPLIAVAADVDLAFARAGLCRRPGR